MSVVGVDEAEWKEGVQPDLKAGVIADWREPDVIRLAPVPLYNTFEEVSASRRYSKALKG